MNNTRSAEIAANTYYWKPMSAFFRSLEMGMYEKSSMDIKDPVLDLGCGDGGVLNILRGIGFVRGSACGIDICFGELKKASLKKQHMSIYQADANQLPFRDEAFSTTISNGVLCSIPQGVEKPLREVNRVLKPGGVFIVTVPTDKFIDTLCLPRILGKVSGRLRSRYVKKLNLRLPHFNAYSPEDWRNLFEINGFEVIGKEEFFPAGDGVIWNVLSMNIFRVFGLTKFVKNRFLTSLLSGFWQKLFRWLRAMGRQRQPPFGYMFLVARKPMQPS